MGYYTAYDLEIVNKEKFDPSIEQKVAIALASLPYYAFTHDEVESLKESPHPIADVIGWDTHKWYDHQEDMKKIAVQFPDCIFALWGQGEDAEDFWVEYYKENQFKFCAGRKTYEPAPEWSLT